MKVLRGVTAHFPTGRSPLFGLLSLCGRGRSCNGIVSALGHVRRGAKGGRRVAVRGFHVCLRVGSSGGTFRRVRDLIGRCPVSCHCRIVLKSICVRGNGGRRTCSACGGMLTTRPSGPVTLFSLTSCCRRAKRGRLFRRRVSALLLGQGIPSSAGIGIVERFVIRDRRRKGSDARIVKLFSQVVRVSVSSIRVPVLCTRCLLSGKVRTRSVPMLRRMMRVSPAGGTTHVALLNSTVQGGSCRRIVGVYRPKVRTAPSTLRFCFCLTVTCGRTRH